MKADQTNLLSKHPERTAKQVHDTAYKRGYAAGVRDTMRTFKEEAERLRKARRPPTLAKLILQALAEHPEGMSVRDIKDWLKSTDSRFLYKTDDQVSSAVSAALSVMKSKLGLVERKHGKWYSRRENTQDTADNSGETL
jgi:hypothetical protein